MRALFAFATAILFSAICIAKTQYGTFDFGKEIPKDRLAQALQAMVNKTYLVGFRTLGNAEDFFHGHVIYDGNEPAPKFILYHTQERAFLYNRYEPKSPYNYVDKMKRNWIQWLDTLKVKDARPYRYDGTKPDWCGADDAYTIDYDMLDPVKLHFNSNLRETSQINFYKAKCGHGEDLPDSDRIAVFLPTGEKVCLRLYDTVPQDIYYTPNFFKYGAMWGRDADAGKIPTSCPPKH